MVQSAIVKLVIHHKVEKDRDCLLKANLGLLKGPGCTTLGWLLIITKCCYVDVIVVTNSVSGSCTQILYNFNPVFVVSDALTTRLFNT